VKKKLFFLFVLAVVVLSACNKEAFIKKLVGDWRVNQYYYDGHDKTTFFDTTYREYTLSIQEGNTFSETWKSYAFFADSTILSDTIGYDSVAMNYVILYDTIRFNDTVVTPHIVGGEWQLINSEEDLQLTDTASTARIFRILDLSKNSLHLKRGNDEYHYDKN
jgi:hypothetical protein